MKKQILLFLVLMMLPMVASADEVEIDGICYNLIEKGNVAEVTRNFNSSYSGNVVIPEKVSYEGVDYKVTLIAGNVTHNGGTYIGGAFRGCSGITSVTIPNSVTSIGYGAFYGCSGMTSVNIPEGVTSIGDYAFAGCSGLTSINIPESATSIGESAFGDCSGLTSITIPSSWSSIGRGVFGGCTGLTSITIPDNINSIEEAAFLGCSRLTDVTIPNTVYSIGNQAFSGCGFTSINIPNSVSYIGKGAFSGCSALTSIIIPESVSSISNGAFARCTSLTSITIPQSVTSIGGDNIYGGAFSGCTALTSFEIPNSVTSIGNQVFIGCNKLKTVIIGSGVKSIGSYAFVNCSELTDVYCHAENVPSTGSDVFRDAFIEYATLYVPEASMATYKIRAPWSGFGTIKLLSGETPEVQKCATPTISYNNGKLTYHCETEGATCQSTITNADVNSYSGNEVQLAVTYKIRVYATKAGCENSDVATATLYWVDATPETEGITNGIANIPAKAVLIQSEGGSIKVQGVDEGTQVNVYSINGTQAGSAISQSGAATINTNLQPGSIAIVKIDQRSVKIVMK